MANGHGGPRTPANPAPVSGPGALSRRTDGQPKMTLPDPKYGEQSAFQAAQSAAPMAQAPGLGAPTPVPSPGNVPPITPIHAPTERPDEPVTAGAALGPGVGPQALGIPTSDTLRNQSAQQLASILPALILEANSDDATPEFRSFVRMVRANLT